MFGALSKKFTDVFSGLLGKKHLSEDNISDAVRQVRLALLDADVSYSIVKTFIKNVKEKALGSAVIKSVKPGEQFIKVIHDELVALMGEKEASLELPGKPAVIMLLGLQGAGKTTHAAKLAHYLTKKPHSKKPLLVACDLQRPAAVLQLKKLGELINVPVFSIEGETDPVKVAKASLKAAMELGADLLILDTAGRLHIDETLMDELERIKKATSPHEVLLVANAATGQDALKTASEFEKRIGLTGTILTMLDGDARAGAAISIKEVTGKPLKFEGIGEKVEDLQLFNPQSMADRILGMGDTINLVKKAQEHISEEDAKSLEKKMRNASFTYDDYLKQMQAFRKMGSIKGLMKMLPGIPGMDMSEFESSEEEFSKIECIILSMTQKEREEKNEIDHARAKRIAKGSGTTLEDVNKLKKSFKNTKKMFKNAPSKKMLEKFSKFGGF